MSFAPWVGPPVPLLAGAPSRPAAKRGMHPHAPCGHRWRSGFPPGARCLPAAAGLFA
jgi:hypothetical protein